jgi:hypothetical protein
LRGEAIGSSAEVDYADVRIRVAAVGSRYRATGWERVLDPSRVAFSIPRRRLIPVRPFSAAPGIVVRSGADPRQDSR